MKLRLKEHSNKFFKDCCALNISPQQRRDMTTAFFSGAAAMFQELCMNLESNDLIMQSDIDKVKDLRDELNKFAKDYRDGVI